MKEAFMKYIQMPLYHSLHPHPQKSKWKDWFRNKGKNSSLVGKNSGKLITYSSHSVINWEEQQQKTSFFFVRHWGNIRLMASLVHFSHYCGYWISLTHMLLFSKDRRLIKWRPFCLRQKTWLDLDQEEWTGYFVHHPSRDNNNCLPLADNEVVTAIIKVDG